MRTGRVPALPMVLIAAGALVVGLSMPAAAHQARHFIDGTSIAIQTIPGNRLKVNQVTGRQVKESTLAAVPQAHLLTGRVWHPLTLQSGWVNYNSGSHGTPSYAMLTPRSVMLRGAISGGANGSIAFRLPAKLHPARNINVASAQANGATGQLGFELNGMVIVFADPDHTTSATGFTSLDGITFSIS
jgi:hypothetical protein